EDFIDFNFRHSRGGPGGSFEEEEMYAVPETKTTRGRGRPIGKKVPKSKIDDFDIDIDLERFRGNAAGKEQTYSGAGDTLVDAPSSNKKIPLKKVQEHQDLINKLNRYAASARYRPIIEECGIGIKNLAAKSVPELKELLERVRACCGNHSQPDIVYNGVLRVAGAAEVMAPRQLLNGYQQALEGDPELAAICELIQIDSGFLCSMTPMQKLGMSLACTAATVMNANRKTMMDQAKMNAQTSSQQILANLIAQRQAAVAAGLQPPSAGIVPAAAPVLDADEEVIIKRPCTDTVNGNPYSGTV
ncbi:MAG: hypothetical protein P4L87_24370, partial [Formivibrio sp.]|nr:hypothetical protein [Formivibrio sp.]